MVSGAIIIIIIILLLLFFVGRSYLDLDINGEVQSNDLKSILEHFTFHFLS